MSTARTPNTQTNRRDVTCGGLTYVKFEAWEIAILRFNYKRRVSRQV